MTMALAAGSAYGVAYAQEEPAGEQPQEETEAQDTSEAEPVQAPVPAPAPTPSAPPPAPPPAPVEDTSVSADVSMDTVVDIGGADLAEQEGEVIILTGSAIERRDLTTPAPLAIVDKSTIDAAGVASIGQVLQSLPSQSNAINVQFNNGGNGATRISLRGLGANRTLVLVNGRRHVPGGDGADAAVDLNAIPIAVIERVEVLKDGASAIYGSDAIGGVVNIIMRNDFEGTEATAYVGGTSRGDGLVYDLSMVTGHRSDRGNVVFAAGYFEQKSIRAGERSYATVDRGFDYDEREEYTLGSFGTPEGTMIVRADDTVGNQAWQDLINGRCSTTLGSNRICFNDPDGGWRSINIGGTSDRGEGDLYNYQPENYLVTPSQRYNVFSTGNYRFHKHLRGFYEASYTNRRSDQLLAPEPLSLSTEQLSVSADNYYNPFGRDFNNMIRRLVEFGNRRFIQDVDTFRIVTGVEGELPKELSGWRWNLAYNYGRTESTEMKQGLLIRSRVGAAVGPSYMDASGRIRCGTPDNPGDPACVPLNLFGGAGTITPDMVNYLTYTGIQKGFTEQKSVVANVTGKLFNTPWGGDVALALGAEYRAEAGSDIPDPRTAVGDTTGNKSEPTAGDFDVYEAYAELSVVPVIGKEFAEWVELNTAARVFNYSTFGSDFTWKAGGLWKVIKGAAVRGTYSTAFRAPSIGQLYQGEADSFPRTVDPCDTSRGPIASETVRRNCAADGIPDNHSDPRAQLPARVGGNPDLHPETANIFTVGAVYEPHFVPGVALTVDYFNIKVTDSIQAPGAGVTLSNCYAQENRSDCNKITRNPVTNEITRIENLQDNIGGAETAGVDITIRYDHNTNVGRFRYSLEGTWLHQYDEIQADGRRVKGKGFYDLGVYPNWRSNFSTMWGLDQYGAGLNLRFVNGFTECEDNDCSGDALENDRNRKVSPHLTADLFGSYSLRSEAGTSRVTVGVNNVLDAKPALIYEGFYAASDASAYDFLGRNFYLRFVQLF